MWSGLPPARGLYDPTLEKDACGVGAVCNINGTGSHQTVRDGIQILERMAHRGACGCEENTGDGAGLLLALPDTFFRRTLKQTEGVILPPLGRYAAGLVFLPKEFEERQAMKKYVDEVIAKFGQSLICWRGVPTNNQSLGATARSSEPCIEQVFIQAEEKLSQEEFEKVLFFIRRFISKDLKPNQHIYVCSLSSRTIVYKGQLTPAQVDKYFIDLGQVDFESHMILVHSRFSTNTFPSWERAQPLRVICHNGEINTLQGNANWMRAREGKLNSKALKELRSIFPIIEAGVSDSGAFDNVAELLSVSGRPIEEAIAMMVPEPWQNHGLMDQDKKNFYEYSSNLMEPWDGPAFIAFTDGIRLGAVLDRNGLRPGRFIVTHDQRVILSSEVGVLDLPDEAVKFKGRLTPGEMFLVDFKEKRIVSDNEVKARLAKSRPYGAWLKKNRIRLEDNLPQGKAEDPSVYPFPLAKTQIMQRLKCFGYTVESMNLLIGPMATLAFEALGSMGNDQALACLSTTPRSIFDYFQQMFAQVTNPPIDPIRESIVMSYACPIGPEGNILEDGEQHCARIALKHPVLDANEFYAITHLKRGWEPKVLDMTFPKQYSAGLLEKSLKRLCEESAAAVLNGHKLIILSDRGVSPARVPIPSLLAVGAVHQHLISQQLRSQVGLVVECGDATEVHHHCLLVGYGVDAIFPWVVYDACYQFQLETVVKGGLPMEKLVENYQKSVNKGMLKVIAKMGISTVQSYKGAQIFEAIGVANDVIDLCFRGTASRIGGCSFEIFAKDSILWHEHAFPPSPNDNNIIANKNLVNPGAYHWRNGPRTDEHMNHPDAIAKLQDSARTNSRRAYAEYAAITNRQTQKCTLRGQLRLKQVDDPIPLDRVEPAKNIVKRFASGAMSYGSISIEAHSTLAVAMNRIGGRSNTGEGGEHISRYEPAPEGQSTRSAIKQVASGRFGVTIYYLTNSDEIQIKMAQGAKPGEGGELPGHKVVGEIAKTRNSTPGVGLISPPPHHDIYSIEDLSQLIFDLKNANPSARISVKLVSEVGVGVIAAGVAKGKAEHILISGHDGGTGASKWTGIKHAGCPWELGIAETHQVLVQNGLRSRVTLQTDGQLKTGLDVVKAALLGAEEFCFATAPLIALGCIMMRKCHLNTCPVGIATQDPELRKMFTGQPEHVVNFLFMVAEEARNYMAQLGIPTFEKLVGRSDLLEPLPQLAEKTKGLDLSKILFPASSLRPGESMTCIMTQKHGLEEVLDRMIIKRIATELKVGKKIRADFLIKNTDRATGTILSHEVTKKWGRDGLPDNTLHLRFKGSAGQSFGAWLCHGVTMELNGDANDYVGKGLSGGRLIIYPPKDSTFKAEDNMIVGNVVLYGAVAGNCFFRGRAAQRFCVRNSGANAVIEGVGDHGCEYMTGGLVVILGPTGRNFAAGMSGGIAYVYDPKKELDSKCNKGLVQLEVVESREDVATLKEMVDQHRMLTGSAVADRLLWDWETSLQHFVKVIPTDYKAILDQKNKLLQEEETKKALAAAPPVSIPKKVLVPAAGKRGTKDIEDVVKPGSMALVPDKDKDKLVRPKKVPNPNKKRGFVEYDRGTVPYRDAKDRAGDFKEIYTNPEDALLKTQAARCMDCGVPFCHQESNGCPLGNKIPEWNELVFQNRWKDALERLLETNNFPEFTGRVCPAPCEGACVLGIIEDPVSIKNIEVAIIDRAFEEGWIVPTPPKVRTGKKVAIIGSGPAGLAAADQLNKAGHLVTVYERADRIGGLLMYGVPNMKLDKKKVVDRRVELMRAEGVNFVKSCEVGKDVSASQIYKDFDAVILATGATKPRDLPIPGRELKGVEFAMEYLTGTTKSYLNSQLRDGKFINAAGKNVIVIGGGDTGNDCLGTAVRTGAKSVVNFELLPKPPAGRAAGNPWPQWPRIFRVDYGHNELKAVRGSDPREFCVLSKRFLDDGQGNVSGIEAVTIQWTKNTAGEWAMSEVDGSLKTYKADLVFLAMGFVGPEHTISQELGVDVDQVGNYKAPFGLYTTSVKGVYACGDCRRGQSLVVWGIAEGRQCAREVDKYLMGSSRLP